jgi:hypothetical protein
MFEMRAKGIFPICMFAAQLLSSMPTGAQEDKTVASSVKPWVETHFPIIAWNILNPTHSPAVKSESLYRDLAEAGYNVVGFVPRQDLHRAKAAGIKAVLYDPMFWEMAKAPVTPIVRNQMYAGLLPDPASLESVVGIYIVDEPTAAAFEPARNAVQSLGAVAPNLWPFITFLPYYAEPKLHGFPDYASYVQAGTADVGAWNFSGCFYGLMEDGTLRDGYWSHLRTLREVTLKNHKPFYHFVLTTPHFKHREPSDADLAFTMFTGLSYGAKGLLHFTACAPPTGNYRLAPIDQFGRKTSTFDLVQNLNQKISTLGPTLLGLKSQRVYFTGQAPAGENPPSKESFVKALDFDAVIGDFTDEKGGRYVLITNTNLFKSQRCDPTLADGSRLELLCPYTGQWKPYEGEQMWLAPGHGVLLRLLPKKLDP